MTAKDRADPDAGGLALVDPQLVGRIRELVAALDLEVVAERLGLDDREVALLAAVVASELDDEVAAALQRPGGATGRPTVGRTLAALGIDATGEVALGLLGRRGRLTRHLLVVVADGDGPFGQRDLSVPDRVLAFVAGDHRVDPTLQPLEAPLIALPSAIGGRLGTAIDDGLPLAYVRDSPSRSGHAVAAAAFDHAHVRAIGFDLRRAGPDRVPYWLAVELVREAALHDAGLVVGPIERLVNRDVEALEPFVDAPVPVVLVGASAWDPSWSRAVPLVLDAPRVDAADLELLWRSGLADGGPIDAELAATVEAMRLTPEQVTRASWEARLHAAAEGVDAVTTDHLRAGIRVQSGGRLEQLAHHVRPSASFDDLVLPPDALAQVRSIPARVRHRTLVLDDWAIGGPAERGRGVTALFAGSSGTGKTLSAEAIAHELGVDLYVIDLSAVVDKYVGETEKNLERVFDEAEGVNGVLLFDEADAMFGKRTGGSEVHDRYANVETAYLLSRMERFDGIAILTTNLRANIDDAFTRRLSTLVAFPDPDAAQRLALWRKHLPATLPCADDVDVELLASALQISGGDIRNIAIAAAFGAAEQGGPVTMRLLLAAAEIEYGKLGRLFEVTGPEVR